MNINNTIVIIMIILIIIMLWYVNNTKKDISRYRNIIDHYLEKNKNINKKVRFKIPEVTQST